MTLPRLCPRHSRFDWWRDWLGDWWGGTPQVVMEIRHMVSLNAVILLGDLRGGRKRAAALLVDSSSVEQRPTLGGEAVFLQAAVGFLGQGVFN